MSLSERRKLRQIQKDYQSEKNQNQGQGVLILGCFLILMAESIINIISFLLGKVL